MQPRKSRFLWFALVFVLLLAIGLHGPSVWNAYQDRKLRAMSAPQLEAVLKTQPADVNARYYLGLAYARDSRFQEATHEFLAVLEKQPARADVLNDLGVTYLLQERYYEALVALQGALTAKPDFPAAMANLGRLHLATQMPYTAARELDKATQMDPRSFEALTDLGTAYQRTLNFKNAETAYQSAIRLNPQYVRAYVGLGKVYLAMGHDEDAEKALNQALKLTPEDPTALDSLARLKIATATSDAELQVAAQLLERAAKADPRDTDVLYDQARIKLRQGQPEEAIKLLTKTLQLSPQNMSALHQLELALRAVGRKAEADRAGQIFRERSLREREETHLEERTTRVPNDWDAKARLAELYLQSGKRGLSVLIIRQMKEAKPDHPRLPMLLKELNPPPTTRVPSTFLQEGH